MLTDLTFLQPGQTFPPQVETERLTLYTDNELLFSTKHEKVWKGAFDKIAARLRRLGSNVEVILNYHQLLSKKTADFVCGEPPEVEFAGKEKATSQDETETTAQKPKSENDLLDAALKKQRFFAKLYEAIIDVSRYGNGVMRIVDKRISVSAPRHWFPVVDPRDIKEITHHVIAYPTAPDPDARGVYKELYAEIHEPGYIEIRRYEFHSAINADGTIGGTIGQPITDDLDTWERISTGLSDFAVQPLTNVTHSSSIYGLDDYTIINSLVRDVMWRIYNADIVLDKHSDPSLSGPKSALSYDPKFNTYFLDLANYFSRQTSEDPDVKYITWDGNLDANFKQIDLLLQQIYILSEMGTAFLEGSDSGGANSGTALRLKLVSPRVKAQRIKGLNDTPVRNLISMLGYVNGINVDPDDLQLTWFDGIPEDRVEDAQRWNVEAAGKQTKSIWTILKERGLSDEEADEELEQIRIEAMASSGSMMAATDPTAVLNPEDDAESEAVI